MGSLESRESLSRSDDESLTVSLLSIAPRALLTARLPRVGVYKAGDSNLIKRHGRVKCARKPSGATYLRERVTVERVFDCRFAYVRAVRIGLPSRLNRFKGAESGTGSNCTIKVSILALRALQAKIFQCKLAVPPVAPSNIARHRNRFPVFLEM